ncbi:ParA family protein [Xanthocytophaga flava]|uniref:ParA family protein n=1 Tax=Xanthocytophaga flava TaxID=3048013 RepID=UPI0028D47B6C|nr:ParA family protein [Xanthocytophaga flavus]MDJ1470280.1 ParA family protein [Xanthocytophaga flavus]
MNIHIFHKNNKQMIIAISIHKGGTGKTTTAFSLGAAFVKQGKKVLLIDLDAQCNLTTTCGINPLLENNVGRWLLEMFSFSEVVQSKLGMDIIPAAYELVSRESDIIKEQGSDSLLKYALQEIKEEYDYIILDCPPSLGIMTTNALVAADKYIIPMLAATYSYEALGKMQNTIEKIKRRMNPSLELAGVLFTNSSTHDRTLLGKSIREATAQQVKVFQTSIRTNKALDEAANAKQAIFDYDPDSTGAKDYLKLAEEIELQQHSLADL